MQAFDYQAYEAYCYEQQCRELDICQSCDGYGNHGIDEDGCVYVCYYCHGDGKYFPPKRLFT